MNKYYFCILIFLCVFITRFLLREQFPIVSDSIGYARGLVTYNIANNEPGFPGYFLYIVMGRFLNLFIHHELAALTLLSTIFSAGVSVLIFIIGKNTFSAKVGLIAAFLFLSSPVFWFLGITALPYIVALFFHAAVIFGIGESVFGIKKTRFWVPLSLALLLGIRPHEFVNVGLPFIYYLTLLKPQERAREALYLGIFCLFWLIPLFAMTGGITAYIQLFLEAFGVLPAPSIQNVRFYFTTVAVSLFTSFTLTLPLLCYPVIYALFTKFSQRKFLLPFKGKQLLFFFLWITPIAVFQLVIKSDHPAHTLALLLPTTVLLSYFFSRLFRKRLVMAVMLALAMTFNVGYFFRGFGSANPSYISYSSIFVNDSLFLNKLTYIKEHFDPKTALIVADHRQWRTVAYFLPQFTIYVFEDVSRQTPFLQKKVFVAHNNQTSRFEREGDSFALPKNVRELVFFENQFSEWVTEDGKQIIPIEPHGSLTLLSISERAHLGIGFHRIMLY